MARISADENLHMVFYRDALSAALDLAPSEAVKAIVAEVIGFEMPGAGMTDYGAKAVTIAKAGIYDLRSHHDDVIWPLLRHWRVFERENLDAEAEQARRELAQFLDALDGQAKRMEEKRARRAARAAAVAG